MPAAAWPGTVQRYRNLPALLKMTFKVVLLPGWSSRVFLPLILKSCASLLLLVTLKKTLSTLLLVPLDDTVVFPNMNVTISADVGEEDRVLLVPRHDGDYAKVGTVAEVAERVRLPGGVAAVSLVGLHRGIAGAAHTDAQGNLRVEVDERPDVAPPGV